MRTPDFTKQYFPLLDSEPFATYRQQQDAWDTFVDMLCAMSLFEIDAQAAGRRERVGSLMSYLEADELIAPPGMQGQTKTMSEPKLPESVRRSVREVFEVLLNKGFDGELAMFPLSRLFMHLDVVEVFAVILALAPTHSRKYERIFNLLSEERDTIVKPTIGLCVDLSRYFLDEWERDVSKLFAQDSFLRRYVLEKDTSSVRNPQLSQTLALRREVLGIILGGGESRIPLPVCVNRLEPPSDDRSIHSDCFREISRLFVRRLMAENDRMGSGPAVVLLAGERGAGKRYLMRSLGKAFESPVLAVDVMLLASASTEEVESCAGLLILLAALEDALVYLHQFPEDEEELPEETRMLLTALSQELEMCFAGVETQLPETLANAVGGPVYRITLPTASPSEQELLWRIAASENGIVYAGDVDLGQIVSKYEMNPGRIYEAVTNAALSVNEDEVVTTAVLEEQIRRTCSVEFGQNATRLSSPFTWEDLMVSSTSEHMLRLAADRIRCRATVLESFGFARKLPYGRGVAIVLYGPPGTGKTMAAQVLAKELGLAIFRVDLSQVSSKYIGETEKNLGAIFDAAKHSNAVLFFDEADALFSKRTEVSSSNDKYANAETSYLLQKIEEYAGVSVLATNNMQNFDAAFKRRMTYIIPLEAPDAETRKRLWEKVFPAEVPMDEEIDFSLLARAIELSGAQIKAIAVACAYRAAAEGRGIVYEDFIEAVDMECAKAGMLHAGEHLRQEIMMR